MLLESCLIVGYLLCTGCEFIVCIIEYGWEYSGEGIKTDWIRHWCKDFQYSKLLLIEIVLFTKALHKLQDKS